MAFERIMDNARRYNVRAELHGVSVQKMVQGGRETIVGMTSDPQFGPGIVFGLGGIFVEVLRDTVVRVPPLDANEARDMIEALKGAALLKGVRGQKPADLSAVADVLCKFSQLCLDLRGAVQVACPGQPDEAVPQFLALQQHEDDHHDHKARGCDGADQGHDQTDQRVERAHPLHHLDLHRGTGRLRRIL